MSVNKDTMTLHERLDDNHRCRGCGEFFDAKEAYRAHFYFVGLERRCCTAAEMQERGIWNRSGYWSKKIIEKSR